MQKNSTPEKNPQSSVYGAIRFHFARKSSSPCSCLLIMEINTDDVVFFLTKNVGKEK